MSPAARVTEWGQNGDQLSHERTTSLSQASLMFSEVTAFHLILEEPLKVRGYWPMKQV